MNTPVVASPGTPTLLTLPGPEAVSPFRLEKMLRSLRETQPAIQHVSTAFMHFVQCAQPLTSDERQVLDKLLTYGRASSIGRLGEQFLVIPRIGTISPWASKATNIAHNCGLAAIRRIERGTVYCIEADGELTAAAREAVLQAIHDPMTETVQAIADGGAAQHRQTIDKHRVAFAQIRGRHIGVQPFQPLGVEHLAGRRRPQNAFDRAVQQLRLCGEGFVPVRRLQAAATLRQYLARQTVGHGAPGERTHHCQLGQVRGEVPEGLMPVSIAACDCPSPRPAWWL